MSKKWIVMPAILVGFSIVLVTVLMLWNGESTAYQNKIAQQSDRIDELKYILDGQVAESFLISELSASDTTPHLNQEVTVSYRVYNHHMWYGDAIKGHFVIDSEECREYLRLDEQNNYYHVDGWMFENQPNGSHIVRVVDMPPKDTRCSVSFVLEQLIDSHKNRSEWKPVEIDKRSVTLEL